MQRSIGTHVSEARVHAMEGKHAVKTTSSSSSLMPMSGPALTVQHTWQMLQDDVASWSSADRLTLKKAVLIAFISLNESSQSNGTATILRSVFNAKRALRKHWRTKKWINHAGATKRREAPAQSSQLEHLTAVILHDALRLGRLSPEDPERVLCFGGATARRARLTGVEEWKAAFRAAVYRSLRLGDGWHAALLLEARSDLLSGADDVHLCREAVNWYEKRHDKRACPELRSSFYSSLRASQRQSRRAGLAIGNRTADHRRRGAAATRNVLCSASNAGEAAPIQPPPDVDADVVIIGGGPAGCTCALYTARANLKTVLLDKNPSTGALAITSHIANYPGVDRTMTGAGLLDLMRDQAIEYGTDYRRAQVFLLDFSGDTKTVFTGNGTFRARALVLATGAMGRPASFEGEDTFLGRGVSYCATCDGAFYEGREVAVVGVNQEAIEEAQFLTKFASTVHWITSSNLSTDDEHAHDLLAEANVKHWPQTKMERIEGEELGAVTGVYVKKRGSDVSEHLPVEGVFIYVAGSKPITDFLTGQEVEFLDDGGVKVDDEMRTNVPGVYAIGDIRNTPYKQVVVAASDGCIAAMALEKDLKGRKSVRVDWNHT